MKKIERVGGSVKLMRQSTSLVSTIEKQRFETGLSLHDAMAGLKPR
jgi:hypothetical protein